MMVLDTHAWVWFVSNPELLSNRARKAPADAMEQKEIFISCISAWEVALLVAKKRLRAYP
jgi:PIN domain nuclease of toxin-antitoxin system